MDELLPSYTAAIVGSGSFQEAALVAGRWLLDRLALAFEQSTFAEMHRVLRAMVHIRPADGYRHLAVIEHETGARELQDGLSASHLPSATAWRWVNERRCAVSIDVALGRVQPHERGVGPLLGKTTGQLVATKETQDRLIGREATHVCALPLRMPGGGVAGMVSLEVECRAAMGQDVIWQLAGEELLAMADIAAPHLAGLPARRVDRGPEDELLPVVGDTMAPLVAMLRVFAEQEETLLLSGPTGAGKSRMARWCKERSARKSGPFEVLDLMTLPEELQMAELFGWKRGAFTGAVKDSVGCVGRAEGGTLFIDEIDKLSLKAQAGLLHLLEERTYRPIGEGAGERRANVRFIIGTNANLPGAVRAGHFREDLYYRIHVLPIRIPALDERKDEIVPWSEYMLSRRQTESGREGTLRLSPAAGEVLKACSWPGNLRQLDNVLRRAYALCLMGRAGEGEAVVLGVREIEQALEHELPAGADSLTGLLAAAARRFVAAAEGKGLGLDDAEAFKGFVLAAAAEAKGGKEEALRLLGKDALLRNRNHHKAFQRELERAQALCQAVGEESQFPHGRWLSS
ncbi:MAG: sigma 54-interacting transcriptional regulator [Polyangiaceae bacterium]